MAVLTPEERFNRLEQVVHVLAEGQLALEKIVAELATETRKGFDRVAEQFAETDRRMRQTDERMKQTDERMRQTDERFRQTDQRIDKLVSAIGELIRSQSLPRA
jgi:methyl-accepting chemotaxis protein